MTCSRKIRTDPGESREGIYSIISCISIMSEEPNPEWLGGQESYDAIVCGTGLKECILSGLLSVDGYKVNVRLGEL